MSLASYRAAPPRDMYDLKLPCPEQFVNEWQLICKRVYPIRRSASRAVVAAFARQILFRQLAANRCGGLQPPQNLFNVFIQPPIKAFTQNFAGPFLLKLLARLGRRGQLFWS